MSVHVSFLSCAVYSILFSKYWSAFLDLVKNGNSESIYKLKILLKIQTK